MRVGEAGRRTHTHRRLLDEVLQLLNAHPHVVQGQRLRGSSGAVGQQVGVQQALQQARPRTGSGGRGAA